MKKHRFGVSFGLLVVVLGGGYLGYQIGVHSPSLVSSALHISGSSIPVYAGAVIAAFSGGMWLVYEAVTGLLRMVIRDVIVVRIGISLIGSFSSLVLSELHTLGINTAFSSGNSILSFLPLASGLGSIAIGAHAILHHIAQSRGL